MTLGLLLKVDPTYFDIHHEDDFRESPVDSEFNLADTNRGSTSGFGFESLEHSLI